MNINALINEALDARYEHDLEEVLDMIERVEGLTVSEVERIKAAVIAAE